MLTWFYYSDTNASLGDLEGILQEQKYKLTHVQRLEDVSQRLKETEDAVLFIKAHTIYNAYDLCQELSISFPHAYIILIVPDNMENTKKAMSVGASNLLRYSADIEEKRDVVIQAVKYLRLRENGTSFHLSKQCKVISVCSTKGGIGRTTTAVNLAAAFAKAGKKVGFLDANLQFGDAVMHFDLKPSESIYEWVKQEYERNTYSLEKYLSKHESGVTILPAPSRPEFFEMITEDHVEKVLNEMKRQFDVIVIDTPSYLSEVHLKCLEMSEECLLLITSELPVLRRSKLFIEALDSFQFSEKIKVILTRETKRKQFDEKKMEQIIGKPIYAKLPNQDSLVTLSVNIGVPFVLTHPRTPIGKGVMSLTKHLYSQEEPRLSEPRRKKRRKRSVEIIGGV